MASYVMIEIDTTSPVINVYAPSYTTKETYNQITIESNESLDLYQDVYLIDNLGTRYNFTLERETSTRYAGYIQLANVSVGLHTLYVRMRDEVRNNSNLMSTVIEVRASSTGTQDDITTVVRDGLLLNVKLGINGRKGKLTSQQRKVKVTDKKTG